MNNMAHYLTLFRLFIGPLFLFIYLDYPKLGISVLAMPYWLLLMIALAEFSDFADGFLARRWGHVTALGKILDPMIDSLYRLSIFLTFTQPPIELPLAIVFIFLYRDFLISILRTICALEGVALAARPSGKLKAVLQSICVFLVLFLLILFSNRLISLHLLQKSSEMIVFLAALYALLSGVEYIYFNRHFIVKLLDKR